MEAAVSSGDATKVDVALRIALASDDPSLRNLGLRTWVASQKRLTLDIVLPGGLQKIVDQAEVDPKQAAVPILQAEWLQTWMKKGFEQTIEFSDVDMSKNTGKVAASPPYNNNPPEDFTVSGAQLTFSAILGSYFRCSFRLAPTSNLTLQGSASCTYPNGGVSPRLGVTAPMF